MSEQNIKEAFRLYDLAIEHTNKKTYDEALSNFQAALDLIPEQEVQARAMVLANIGLASVQLEKYEEASKAFSRSAELFKESGDILSLAEQLGNIGSVYRDIGDMDEALSYYFKALEFFEQENRIEGISFQYSNIGYAYSRKGKVIEAQDYFEKAAKLFDELGDKRKADMCRQNIKSLENHRKGMS